MLKKLFCATIIVPVFVCVCSAVGQQNSKDKKQSNLPTVNDPKPAAPDTKADGKPLSKELSDKLLQYAALQAEKQKELNESKPARELALINDALEVLVSDALRTLGLDSKKYALKKNPQTGLLEAVPLAVPVPEPPR